MTLPEVAEKVDYLGAVLGEFIVQTQRSFVRLENEMIKFKDEMKDFKDEMKDFKDEMKDFKDEMRADTKTMKKQWAELTDKLGSFAEDISLPNIPRIAQNYFNEPEVLTIMPTVRKRNVLKKGDEYEFDGIVETTNKIFLMEAKFTVRMDFVNKLPTVESNFRAVFPEYAGKEFVFIFASMAIPENVVKKLTKLGIYALSLGDDNMDLLNFSEIQKKKKNPSA
jgi:predicted nuclease with TOPRIM domain